MHQENARSNTECLRDLLHLFCISLSRYGKNIFNEQLTSVNVGFAFAETARQVKQMRTFRELSAVSERIMDTCVKKDFWFPHSRKNHLFIILGTIVTLGRYNQEERQPDWSILEEAAKGLLEPLVNTKSAPSRRRR